MKEFSSCIFQPALLLDEPILVEASAGTGKTYNIQNAYLRLILERELTVRQILVVTFTEAATLELRERLRAVLVHCHDYLEAPEDAPSSADSMRIEAVMKLVNPQNDQARRMELNKLVQLALMDFDSAAIFTIHGFCNRVLAHYAFECGHDPDAELLSDASAIVTEACRDWWRKNAYASEDVPFTSFSELLACVQEVHRNPAAILKTSAIPNEPEFHTWFAECNRIAEQIQSPNASVSWAHDGNLLVGKTKPYTVDTQVLRRLARDLAPRFLEWEKTLPLDGKDQSPICQSLLFTFKVMHAPSHSHDAKRFAQAVKAFGKCDFAKVANLNDQPKIAKAISDGVLDRIRDRIALTYDSMLANVRAVLGNAKAGPILRALLRDEFKAALIDEFQDTDPIQYDIFWSLFGEPQAEGETPTPLVFVGDPKQAIYGFRGGDIFTYFAAKQKIPEERRYSLGTNFRSEANLVQAINALFADGPSDRGPTFLNHNVPYAGDLQANNVGADKELLLAGQRDPQPLKIWRMNPEHTEQWPALVTEEIERLLKDPSATLGAKPIQPGHFAVLVMNHKEALEIQEALVARGVNAVRQAVGKVFDSEDAPRLAILMQAILEPGKSRFVRSALATGLLPCTPAMLARFKAEDEVHRTGMAPPAPPPSEPHTEHALPTRFDDWLEAFREAKKRWEESSFIEAFRFLATRLQLFPHLAQQENGRRRIAEVQQLVEVAHQEASRMRLGPIALTTWFARQTDPDARDEESDSDELRLRAADDDDAVQIMTVFKSKGLQFPIVFVPTLSQHSATLKRGGNAKVIRYHSDNRLVLDFDTSKDAPGEIRATEEMHEENIRKAYVALTRAINRVYLFSSKEHSKNVHKHAVAHLLARFSPANKGSAAQPDCIALEDAPALQLNPPANSAPPKTIPDLRPRTLLHPVDKKHGHASFSALASHRAAAAKEPDVRDVDQSEATAPEAEAMEPDPIFSIPGGAKLGECWHEIFELIDFQAPAATLRETTDAVLDKYRICPRPTDAMPLEKQKLLKGRRDAVHRMIANTLATPLPARAGALSLRDIPLAHRRSELEFNFSMRDDERALQAVAPILERDWKTPARNEAFIKRMRDREMILPRGFMTGFMDLVFQHAGKFYIVDWKSNRLAGRADGFDDAGIAAEMDAHAYYLQYLIYSVALHGFLATRLARYDFDTHFGGVFYLFVRGMDGKTRRGVFSDAPSRELVAALSSFFGGPA
ncbi:MAG: UvrD-helicase domain-containing protein [Kiritimatiellae bacterium]|nr:UvrD-helicase domain-containing protein [Kiritimatiellia bacterium]